MQSPGSLIIYRASAGAGKTFTLVQEYLKIVLVHPHDFRHVLAITFTNKATEEMKSRILETLATMARSSPDELQEMPMYKAIKSYLLQRGKADPEVVIKHARETLRLILAGYSHFSVSTIESFFQKIIRSFSRELNIPLGFEVDMKQEVVLEEVMQGSLRAAGKEALITRLLSRYLQSNLSEEKGWRIEGSIKKLGGQIFQEQFQELLVGENPDPEALQEQLLALEKELKAFISKTDNFLQALAREALQHIENAGLSVDDFYQKKRGPAAHFNKVLNKDYELNSYAKAAVNEGKWGSKGTSDEALALAEEVLSDILIQLRDGWESQKVRYNSARVILNNLHRFALLFDLQKRLVEYREAHSRLIISDTNLLLKKVVGDQETPFIYEKVGNRYHYFLIDEFQDTSDMQWANLLPLVTNVLAQGYHSLLVGDVKQSIYRWRNGNPDLLMYEAQTDIEKTGAQVDPRSLAANWRTAREIVDFNNRLFPLLAARLAADLGEDTVRYLQAAYADVEQKAELPFASPGLVQVESLLTEKEDPDLDWRSLALTRSLESIRELREEGFRLDEIALLVRTNKEGTQLAEFLQAEGLEVASPDALLISGDTQVRFLVAALRWLEDAEADLNIASLAYASQLLEGDISEPDTVFRQGESGLPEALLRHRDTLRKLPVLPCLERICQLVPALHEPNAFVSALLDQALTFSNTQDTSLTGFLAFWDEDGHKAHVAVGGNEGALQLMTIHKAKGLEFPVVIVPFGEWDIKPKNSQWLWVRTTRTPFDKVPFYPVNYSKTLADTYFSSFYEKETRRTALDNLNLLYVAFTRPKYRLYIFSPRGKPGRTGPDPMGYTLRTVLEELNPRKIFETETGTVYQWGEQARPDTSKATEAGQGVVTLRANHHPLLPWEGAVRIRLGVGRFLRADRLAREAAVAAGELLHEALARVHLADDVEAAVSHLVSRGMLAQQEADAFARVVKATISVPEVASWYDGSWAVMTEVDIIRENGTVLRPDRVMEKAGTTLIVDYKTGLPRNNHQQQVRAYADAVGSLVDGPVRACLYYTDRQTVEWVL